MLKFIRYALATCCFVTSIGCLLLWWRSMTRIEYAGCVIPTLRRAVHAETKEGMCVIFIPMVGDEPFHWAIESEIVPRPDTLWEDRFPIYLGKLGPEIYFPLWYPALVFALAGVGILRFSRQFSIRSALIGLAVVAALLAMVVAL